MFDAMSLKELGKRDIWAVVLALFISAGVYAVDHQATVITWTVMLVVWVLNMLLKWQGIQLGRKWITVILFSLATLLTVVFEPVTLPAFPVWGGDAAAYVDLMIVYVQLMTAIASGIYAAATALYNILLRDVLDKLWYSPNIDSE